MSSVVSPAYNTARVLRLLWLHPGISRSEMAVQLRVNRSTVSNIVNELIDRGLVVAVALGDASPSGGRKKIQLAVNPRYGCAGGIQVHADYVRMVLVDLGRGLLYDQVTSGAVNGRNLVSRVEKACLHLEERAAQLSLRLLGVGCGLPGIVDPYLGTLLQSIPLGTTDPIPLVERLQPQLGAPLFVDNDVHSCCWGELVGTRLVADNFLFILGDWRRAPHRVGTFMTAIGTGVAVNRRVHYGRGFSAGEFRSLDWVAGNASQFSLTDDQIAAARTDVALYRTMMRELARNAAMVVHMLDLDRVYLGGFFDPADVETQAIFTEQIRRNWTYPTQPRCEVSFATHGDHAVAFGGASLVFERAFSDPDGLHRDDDTVALAMLTDRGT
jgi:predicted NBD/HSP70 family sugar kinase